MNIMKDIDIREPLIEKIVKLNEGHNYRIIPELTICDGLSRADIAVANGNLYGYEIKSDADTLDRLPLQKEFYNKTFDKVFIVVGSKYKSIIEEYIPDWWGVYVAYYDREKKILLKLKKRGRKNTDISAESLLELLWKNEIENLLKLHGVKGLSGKNRRILRQIALNNLSLKEIKDYTRETLKTRKDWR